MPLTSKGLTVAVLTGLESSQALDCPEKVKFQNDKAHKPKALLMRLGRALEHLLLTESLWAGIRNCSGLCVLWRLIK